MATEVERFESKFTIGPGCWEWHGAGPKTNYPYFTFRGRHEGAHRIAWRIYQGKLPEGMFVCHTCDNRRCVRPDHLFVGDHQDNMQDMFDKGRAHGVGKLKIEAIERIFELHANGDLEQRAIAKIIGCSQTTVHNYLTGKSNVPRANGRTPTGSPRRARS